jgi:predicted GIY-YIG superfamily endonuclease
MVNTKTLGMIYIYCLLDPITNEVRYVGQTAHPKRRLSQHRQARYGNTYLNNWIEHLASANASPVMKILGSADTVEKAADLERFYIASYKEASENLLNRNRGGAYRKTRLRKISLGDLQRITLFMDEDDWKALQNLPGPEGKPNASFHVREALRMYLRVLEVEEGPCGKHRCGQHSAKLFEDRESDESIHASSIG